MSENLFKQFMGKLGLLQGGAESADERWEFIRQRVVGGKATIKGRNYPMRDWSLNGFCIGPCVMDAGQGMRLRIAFSIPTADSDLTFECPTVVTRYDEEAGEFGGIFLHLDDAVRSRIDTHFAALA